MSTATKTDGMKYEATGSKTVDGKAYAYKAYRKAVSERNSAYTLWLLAVKHKIALLTIGNIVLVLNWAFPEWPQIVLGLFGK